MSWKDQFKDKISEKAEVVFDDFEKESFADIIAKYNNFLDSDMLREQMITTENQKINHKRILLIVVICLVVLQLIFTNVLIVALLGACTIKSEYIRSFSSEEMGLVLTFVKYFIGATIVEILGMLLFIIQSSFDKSIFNAFSKK